MADKNVHNLSFKDVQIEFKEHQPTASNISLCILKKSQYRSFNVSHHKNHKIQRDSDMGIHIDHLSLFVVGSGHIFVGDIAVLSEGVKC